MTRESALSFLLTHIVVEKSHALALDPTVLFLLNEIAEKAQQLINEQDELIPHEVIEELADDFLRGRE